MGAVPGSDVVRLKMDFEDGADGISRGVACGVGEKMGIMPTSDPKPH